MQVAAKQLKADLAMIGEAVKRATDVPDGVKFLFREVLSWSEAAVNQIDELDERVDSAEAALDELLDGSGEMLMPETAAMITSAFEHTQLLCTANLALFSDEGPLKGMDELTKKRFIQLIDNVQRAIALASQTVNELIATDTDEENADADDGRGDRDGDGDGEPAADDDEVEEDEAG